VSLCLEYCSTAKWERELQRLEAFLRRVLNCSTAKGERELQRVRTGATKVNYCSTAKWERELQRKWQSIA